MAMMAFVHILVFLTGLATVMLTLFSAISTFVLPRAARSRLNRLVFASLRKVFKLILRFAKTYERRDAIMAYYAPIGIMLLVPAWYILISLGFAMMYWALSVENVFQVLQLRVYP